MSQAETDRSATRRFQKGPSPSRPGVRASLRQPFHQALGCLRLGSTASFRPDHRGAFRSGCQDVTNGAWPRRAARSGEPPEVTTRRFDLAALPSLDSIRAQTDITVFLQSGVPTELRLAALRRAWTMDPAIRDFKELAENDWDFNDLNSIPGFGELGPEVDVKTMVALMVGEPPRLAERLPRRSANLQRFFCRQCVSPDLRRRLQLTISIDHMGASPCRVQNQSPA